MSNNEEPTWKEGMRVKHYERYKHTLWTATYKEETKTFVHDETKESFYSITTLCWEHYKRAIGTADAKQWIARYNWDIYHIWHEGKWILSTGWKEYRLEKQVEELIEEVARLRERISQLESRPIVRPLVPSTFSMKSSLSLLPVRKRMDSIREESE